MFERLRHHNNATTGEEAATTTTDTSPAQPAAVPRASTTDSGATAATPTTREKRSRFREGTDLEAGIPEGSPEYGWIDPYGPAPGFKEWWKLYWHDITAFIFLAAIALWLLMWSPVPYNKYFAVTQVPREKRSDVVYPEFAYPKRKQFIPIIPDAMIAIFTPIVTIVIVNFFGIGTYHAPGKFARKAHRRGTFLLGRGSFWNVNNGCMGVIYSVMTGATIQIIIKLAVPGLRPHFLDVCDPQIPSDDGVSGKGYNQLYYTATVCRDYKNRESLIANAMQSFPSGHSVAAWAGLLYLSLYLNAHLKIFSNYHPSYWKLLVFVAPLVAATIIVGSLFLDMSHNWYDIAAGSFIGCCTAVLGYRMCFAAVWDFRWNHVPLKRGDSHRFSYGADEMRVWSGGCATRRAGWGMATGHYLGAPGDSCGMPIAAMGMKPGMGSVNGA